MNENETPYTSNMSGDDVLGRFDLYVDPLSALFAQNIAGQPLMYTGIPPMNPFNLHNRDNKEIEEEDELRK
ncbi:MAG: hypothetical protein NC394_02030 [Bacteroides sp.]|nr:hypothetical protein [Bacteroides sp.]